MSTIEEVFCRTDEMVPFQTHFTLQRHFKPTHLYWTGVFDLLGIVMRFCGLDYPRGRLMREEEEAEVKATWEQGKLSHDGFISDLSALVDRP
ncbi:BQ5605_C005g03415 [Microbotryum silenes-dioicae]|uniref:BQ5605_C005g03415 protein n=1 Tax=Microbotryum silenes-dioicae TaxID=796604 RepID=A0A2X0MAK2_9BASI|nr:BQ5605_C005g03415 [Microbotryum silenes-dioicae]